MVSCGISSKFSPRAESTSLSRTQNSAGVKHIIALTADSVSLVFRHPSSKDRCRKPMLEAELSPWQNWWETPNSVQALVWRKVPESDARSVGLYHPYYCVLLLLVLASEALFLRCLSQHSWSFAQPHQDSVCSMLHTQCHRLKVRNTCRITYKRSESAWEWRIALYNS